MKILVIAGIIVLIQTVNVTAKFKPLCPMSFPEPCEDTANTKPGQMIDQNGCLSYFCAPKQPYCCGRSEIRVCGENSYSVEVYDLKTGCLIWDCAPCSDFNEEDGMNMCCLIGTPCKTISSIGCPIWSCC